MERVEERGRRLIQTRTPYGWRTCTTCIYFMTHLKRSVTIGTEIMNKEAQLKVVKIMSFLGQRCEKE